MEGPLKFSFMLRGSADPTRDQLNNKPSHKYPGNYA